MASSEAFSRASMSASMALSMRLMKKLATLSTLLGSPPLVTSASRPEMYASATAS
jgi:hypothetical protein